MNGITLKTLRKAIRDLKRRGSMNDSTGQRVAIAVTELEFIEAFLTREAVGLVENNITPVNDPRDVLRGVGYKL